MSDIAYQPKQHIAIIESARGFAALYVVLNHVTEMLHLTKIFPQDSVITLIIKLLFIYGDQAVLLFFVLSGFSIHYTSADRNLLTRPGLLNYYYLRWRRIYPIFILAICLTYGIDLLGYWLHIDTYTKHIQLIDAPHVLSTLGFLTDRHYIDGILMPTPEGDAPLWSLSYEVFYYLIYPLYWYINQRWGFISALTTGFVLSISTFALGKLFGPQHFYNVIDLYVIWCLGAVLAEMHRRNITFKLPMLIHAPIIYVLLQSAWVLENAIYTVGAFFEVTWGVFFFFVMLLFLNPQRAYDMNITSKLTSLFIGVAGYIVIIIGVHKLNFVHDLTLFYTHITLTLILFALGLFVSRLDVRIICRTLLDPVYSFGKSSYGIYIIHYPLMLITFTALPLLGLPAAMGIIVIPFILYLAHVIELQYQPAIIKHTDKFAARHGMLPVKRG
jgi:peptidoglycan/LPS O-acetylase OafA/YrhL